MPGLRAVVLQAVIASCSLPGVALAQSVPWMPGPFERHAIELLVDEAGLDLTTTQWPLPREAVSHALAALPGDLPPRLAVARDRVMHALTAADRPALSLTARNRADALPGFGDDETPGSSIALRSAALAGPHVALQLGGRFQVNADPDRASRQFRLDDTALVVGGAGIQLQAFAHKAWWSPGWQSALSLGSNAPPFAGIGLQRSSASTSESPWLSWLGPWNIDVFLAQEEGVREPAHPYFLGTRLTLRPRPWLEIGLTRTAQWGGHGRDESGRSFVHLLTGKDLNAGTAAAQRIDPGNEMAGLDLRARCPAGLGCAAYLQLMGEDQAGVLPSHDLGLYGLDWALPGEGGRVLAEYVETGCRSPIGRSFLKGCAYRNYAYPEGYTQSSRWIGSAFGPDSRVLTLGWLDAATETQLKLHVGRIGARTGAFVPFDQEAAYAGHLVGLSARRSFDWNGATVTPQLDWQRIAGAGADDVHRTVRAGVDLRFALDDGIGARRGGTAFPAWTDVAISAGLIGGAALLDAQLDHVARRHEGDPAARLIAHGGSLLPLIGTGAAGAAWLLQRDSPSGATARGAFEAAVTAAVAAEAVKFAVDRARPDANQGAGHFGGGQRRDSSFPSLHTAVAWALVTPYAEQEHQPWLYGAAAVTNLARVAGREHWFSDTVAGAVLGWWIGDAFARRSGDAGGEVRVLPNRIDYARRF